MESELFGRFKGLNQRVSIPAAFPPLMSDVKLSPIIRASFLFFKPPINSELSKIFILGLG